MTFRKKRGPGQEVYISLWVYTNTRMYEIIPTMRLTGKTQKGKNRIREHGNDWVLIRVSNMVLFDKKPGQWFLVAPCNNGSASRWIHSTNDKDFGIKSLTL